jgi:hypothetical protein
MLSRFISIVAALASHHGHHDTARLDSVARDIYAAAESAPIYCAAEGTDAAEYATALTLAGIVEHEAGWHPRVQGCTYRGDPALSLFALYGPAAMQGHSRAEVCGNNLLAATLSIQVLARYRAAGSLLTLARGYAAGDSRVVSRAAKEIADLIATLLWRERLTVAYRDRCLTAEYMQ